jgi:hypothetical protein
MNPPEWTPPYDRTEATVTRNGATFTLIVFENEHPLEGDPAYYWDVVCGQVNCASGGSASKQEAKDDAFRWVEQSCYDLHMLLRQVGAVKEEKSDATATVEE